LSFLDAMLDVVLELAPFLLLGMAVAGLLHVALPDGFVARRLRGRLGVVRAVLLGIPLPLCSCGVIPAALGLRRDGASRGAAIGFLISTPQTGVDSFLVSATFLGWPFAAFKVAAAAVTGIAGGWLADGAGGREDDLAAAAPVRSGAPRRRNVRAMALHAVEILRSIWHWIVIGVVVSAAITTFVPATALRAAAGQGVAVSALLALAVSVPLYVCATASVPIAAALVAGGFPPAAALVFLMAGPATNVATIGAIRRALGGRALAAYLAAVVGGSLGLGVAFDFLVAPAPGAAGHVHGGAAWWQIASAAALAVLIGWLAVDDARAALRRRRRTAARAGDRVVTVGVAGMTCESCVSKLEAALLRERGVRAVEVSLADARAVVRGDVDEATVERAIASVGFRPAGDVA
jgi:uncharacterized membrane protein YraQ (UPF0718 family)/copper chaperone CopZ